MYETTTAGRRICYFDYKNMDEITIADMNKMIDACLLDDKYVSINFWGSYNNKEVECYILTHFDSKEYKLYASIHCYDENHKRLGERQLRPTDAISLADIANLLDIAVDEMDYVTLDD